MSEQPHLEPERYELTEPARYQFDLDRRDFIRVLSIMGGGLLVVATHPLDAGAQESGRGGQGGAPPSDLTSWIHIDRDGRVTAFTGKVEIGQNIRTSLAQVVSDELRVPMSMITMVMADTDLTPFDQGTFGSRTTPTMAPVLARAAAFAREQLVARAAAMWRTGADTLTVDAGQIRSADGRTVTYRELVASGALTGVIAANTAIASKPTWKVRGEALKKTNGVDIVTGRHAFTPDMVRPGMLYGRVIRPPAYGSTLVSIDAAAAKAIPGVQVVRDGDFAGAVASNERVLDQAVAAVRAEWTAAPSQPDSNSIYAHLKSTAPDGNPGRPVGDVAAAKASAAFTLASSFRIPYIAHVPLEPRAAVAEWNDGKVTVWTGTQRPFGVRTEVAQAFKLNEDRVRVIVPDMGSGYGGKHTGEVAIEAARLARAAGKPVKLVYRRWEEFMWAYFRPAGVIDVSASVDASGNLTAWEFVNYNSGSAGLPTPYTVPNQHVEFKNSNSPLRQGSYRGLAATANHYAREMHMDAVAQRAKIDPVEFRRRHIAEPRLRAVLDAVADKIGWGQPRPRGKGVGIACGTEKGSYVATAAVVSPATFGSDGSGGFNLERIVIAFECGSIVNPEGLRNQVEGSVVQGLGGALFEAIQFKDGKLLNGTMADYRVPRFKDVPPIEIILIDRPDLPSAGAGETPIVCVAPAIGSAVRGLGNVALAPALPIKIVGVA